MAEKRHLSKKDKKLRTAAAVLIAAYVIFLLLEAIHIIDFLAARIIGTAIYVIGSIIISILIRKDRIMQFVLLASAAIGFFYLINLIIIVMK